MMNLPACWMTLGQALRFDALATRVQRRLLQMNRCLRRQALALNRFTDGSLPPHLK
jgi:hypothetical protein